MPDRPFPQKLAYRDLLFVRRRGKDWEWHRQLLQLKTEFKGSARDTQTIKARRRKFLLEPAWIASVVKVYFYTRIALLLLFVLSIAFVEFIRDLGDTASFGIYWFLALGLPFFITLMISDDALALHLVQLRKRVIVAWHRSITFIRRISFFARAIVSFYVFGKRKRAQEKVFRLAPREFSLFGISPVNQAYTNLVEQEASDVLLQAFEDGVHKDLCARGLLQLSQDNACVLEKLAADTEHAYAGHALAWLARLQKSSGDQPPLES